MSRTSRVFNIVSGVVMIICSWILFRNPDVGLEFAAMILGISLFLSGIHYLYYYFSACLRLRSVTFRVCMW